MFRHRQKSVYFNDLFQLSSRKIQTKKPQLQLLFSFASFVFLIKSINFGGVSKKTLLQGFVPWNEWIKES